ncbi:cache domain-containing protein [Sphingobium sp. HBC34]|uniref:Cache domain-containing protein n=1 Tax=Sphingobium cyanobacteriorum TaxID=3063954 RepID=A0ABT8ZLJ0_9SPHN|nr:cache domain-containing protein [Sphingobium sp. HBC34]MDO7835409.1 cache domain-containing protein [Sphingobium sp. HBC34]
MLSHIRPLLIAASLFALPVGGAFAETRATAADARALLEKAVRQIGKVGAEQAFADFNKPKGSTFNSGELYVFAFDLNGIYEAYGAQPALVGKDVRDLTDAEGKPIVRDMIDIARTSGRGQINYVWLNRADNHVEHKLSLIERVGNHVIGVGYYAD